MRESEEVGENWTTHLLLGRSRFVGVEGIKNLHLSDCGCVQGKKDGPNTKERAFTVDLAYVSLIFGLLPGPCKQKQVSLILHKKKRLKLL